MDGRFALAKGKHNKQQTEQYDAINLLYDNTLGGLFVNAAASTCLVFLFKTAVTQQQKYWWWGILIICLTLRFIDYLYFKTNEQSELDNLSWAFKRFFIGALCTACLWGSYIFIVGQYASPLEIAYALITISAMAGGSATVLAGSKVIAMTYSAILLIPPSLYLCSSEQAYQQQLGILGLIFGFIMIFSSKKTATFTKNAIKIKHQHLDLINRMERDISKRAQQIYNLSNLDALTKLYNRNAFNAALTQQIKDSAINKSTTALLFIDLNGFKYINDAHGHMIGDKILQVIAKKISKLELSGCIGRWGGDEFVIGLANSNPNHAIHHAKQIIKAVTTTIFINNLKLNVGATIGIALAPKHTQKVSELIQFADIAMYEQKKCGDDSPKIYSTDLLLKSQKQEYLREELRQAINNREFFIEYQPIVSANTEKLISVEALLRWSLNGKIVQPSVFIEVAEQSGLIIEIGKWILLKACLDAAEWQQIMPCKLSINVSILQLLDSAFIETLDFALIQSRLAPELLVIEITESIFAEDKKKIKDKLNAIKARQVGLSIDDFGTGYSSLSQLQTCPFDIIKIDRSFVEALGSTGEAIIKATLFIAKEFNCQTIAEGVELPQQAMTLKKLGINYLQGTLYSKPQNLASLLKLMRSLTPRLC